MTEEDWRELFREVGIEAGRIGLVLRWNGRSMRLYFNLRMPNVGVYFASRVSDEDRYPLQLWERIDPRLLQAKDQPEQGVMGIRPLLGKESEAFRKLLADLEGGHHGGSQPSPLSTRGVPAANAMLPDRLQGQLFAIQTILALMLSHSERDRLLRILRIENLEEALHASNGFELNMALFKEGFVGTLQESSFRLRLV